MDKELIKNYAFKNTSKKMPIESKFVTAFVDSLLNSSSLQDKLSTLKDITNNGNSFLLFNSLWPTAKNVNTLDFRSIIAYAMLKKDFTLFELISSIMFTGYVVEYHGTDLFRNVVKYTDEVIEKFTDEDLYTDMSEGLIQIGFHNLYCPSDEVVNGIGSEYQNLEELNSALINFENIITIVKPARIETLLFFEPYCYLSGDKTNVISVNLDVIDSPFGGTPENPNTSVEILNNMTDSQILACYNDVKMEISQEGTDTLIPKEITSVRTVERKENSILLSYDLKCKKEDDNIWGKVTIESNSSSNLFVSDTSYNEVHAQEGYYQVYVPILLAINPIRDGEEVVVLGINNNEEIPIGAMLYIPYRS